MIFRLSSKLAAKLKVAPAHVLALDPNLFADWSGHVFTAQRVQFLIVTNTESLYSTVLCGRGVTDVRQFAEQTLSSLRDVMQDEGLPFGYEQLIASACGTVSFSKSLNRSMIGSMNDLIRHAKFWLTERALSPRDTSSKLNVIPFSSLKYRQPREAFRGLASGCDL